MAQNSNKKQVEQITDMEVDFAQWYTDVCKKAELIDYSSIKGMFIYRPYGYAIWENIQHALDQKFKETGHENVYLPMLIPESLLQKEKDHVEGFAPECAWVTMGGSEKLEERYCIRPTSETLFCEHYKNVIHSHRDLPKLYNQWCSVLRWEKTSRPFLRHREFLWQEGHTMHATAEEAREETMRMLNVYADFLENVLAMPVVRGRKTDKEKFNGAEETYTVECMMHDRKALQSGTSHYFGDGFARAFDITFTGKDNQLHHPHQTSWGVSTRMIGGIIMTHGDNSGLVLPPRIAPIQAMVIPVAMHKPGVLDAAAALLKPPEGRRRPGPDGRQRPVHGLEGRPVRDEGRAPAGGDRPQGHGEEPVRASARRDTGEKVFVSLDRAGDPRPGAAGLGAQRPVRAGPRRIWRTTPRRATPWTRSSSSWTAEGGFAKTMWCGELDCELKMKEQAGVTSRCMPLKQEQGGRHLRLLRQARQAHDLLGRGVLKPPHTSTPNTVKTQARRPAGAASFFVRKETVKKACHCEADSPYQGEMSRRDKRDREAQRADAAIRNPRPLAPLLKGAVSEADGGIPFSG